MLEYLNTRLFHNCKFFDKTNKFKFVSQNGNSDKKQLTLKRNKILNTTFMLCLYSDRAI